MKYILKCVLLSAEIDEIQIEFKKTKKMVQPILKEENGNYIFQVLHKNEVLIYQTVDSFDKLTECTQIPC